MAEATGAAVGVATCGAVAEICGSANGTLLHQAYGLGLTASLCEVETQNACMQWSSMYKAFSKTQSAL